jgi:RNA polymerase sigma factor (TIGR02999 family)
MDAPDPVEITALLKLWGQGDAVALERLTPLVYDQLLRVARHHMHRERVGHTLQPTALVHEAFLRLSEAGHVEWRNRTHFFAVAARMMRRILVDAARKRGTVKRGGEAVRVAHATPLDFDALPAPFQDRAAELCDVDDALMRLSQVDPRRAQVIELRFFGGLTVEETAEVLQISPQSVMRDWRLARAWLTRELRGEQG